MRPSSPPQDKGLIDTDVIGFSQKCRQVIEMGGIAALMVAARATFSSMTSTEVAAGLLGGLSLCKNSRQGGHCQKK
jgi:hypothetical protein